MNRHVGINSDSAAVDHRSRELTPEQLVRINRYCDEFEKLWRDSGSPSLADFLNSIDPADREHVQPELVLIDIEIRRARQLPLVTDDYLKHCPGIDRTWVEQQLRTLVAGQDIEDTIGLKAGQRVGDYVIIQHLGSGGMGSVYRAEHVVMKRSVAIKVVQHHHRSSPLTQRRFEREVRAIASLSHPNIVTAFDARQEEGWMYLVTEYIEGVDLGALVRSKGPLSPIKAAHYVWQATRGLLYAHQQGVVHRDIKPDNLLLDQNQNIKILDLGLARWRSDNPQEKDESSLTQSNQMLGTASYMAPEQARSAGSADVRSDIYSLGCTLYYLLTGRPPYRGDSMVETILAHVEHPVPALSSADGALVVPPRLEQLVQRMLAKDPQHRPASMREVKDELGQIIKQLQFVPAELVDPPATMKVKSALAKKGLNWLSGISALVGLLLLLVLAWRLWPPVDQTPVPVVDPPPTSLPATAARAATGELELPQTLAAQSGSGISFNGVDRYVDVADFNEEIRGWVAIEAVVTPDIQYEAANIVTWSGEKSFVLFRGQSRNWGIAFFDGTRSHLVLSNEEFRPGQTRLVAGLWDGDQLSLFIDGQPIPVRAIEYRMVPAVPRLYIGGIPDGVIPAEQGPRYFRGVVQRVRIRRSQRPLRMAQSSQAMTVDTDTLALFDLRQLSQNKLLDHTQRRVGVLKGAGR